MSEDAWLSDGANEVSGNRISYDLISEYIIADSDETGQVRMKINPPQNSGAEATP
jgi:lipopolysaccharide export system protein LptA